jgi:hypothetical protein
MSVNLEIHVGLWIPKSVPYTVISASLSLNPPSGAASDGDFSD